MKCKEPKYAFLQSQHLLFKDSPKIILCKNESQIYDMYGVSPPCRFKFLPRNMTKTEFYNTVNNIKRGKDIDTLLLSLITVVPIEIFSLLGMRNCEAEVIKSTTRGRSLWFDWCNHFFILMLLKPEIHADHDNGTTLVYDTLMQYNCKGGIAQAKIRRPPTREDLLIQCRGYKEFEVYPYEQGWYTSGIVDKNLRLY